VRRVVLIVLLCLLPVSVSAQVVHDTSCESTLTQSVASHSCSLTASASTKGILVFTFNINTTNDNFTGVTDGGAHALTAVASCSASDSAGEPGSVKAWFIGSGMTTGTQTITAARTNNTDPGYMIAISVTAGGDTQAISCAAINNNAALSEQSIDDGSPGVNSVRYGAVYYGLPVAGNLTAVANSTLVQDASSASQSGAAARETTAGQGARSVGFAGASDDQASVRLAIKESGGGGGGGSTTHRLLMMGVGLR
jgi:hypothetical protein